ncbi:chloride channel [Paraphysoderma sedebokerense]|nr:chloride channel [Paraphysoderma sedebokerense]
MQEHPTSASMRRRKSSFKAIWGPKQTHRRRMEKMVHTESVNVEDADNPKLRKHYANLTRMDEIKQELSRYLVCAIVGIIAAFGYTGLHTVTHAFSSWKYDMFLSFSEKSIVNAWAFNTGVSLLFAIVGTCASIYEPTAQGSGMPEVIAYLNGVERRRFLSAKTLIFKIIGMVCIVCAGLLSGYDGPFIHCTTLLSIILVRNIKKIRPFAKAFYAEHSNELTGDVANVLAVKRERELRTFAVMGSVAGMASAFHVVLAGVMFALEEAVSYFEPTLIVKSLFTGLIAVVSIMIYNGKKLSSSAVSLYAVNTTCKLAFAYQDLLVYLVMGLAAGIMGHFYNIAISKIRAIRSRYVQPKIRRRIFEVLLLVFITSTVVSFLPRIPSINTCTSFDRSVRHMVRSKGYHYGSCEQTCTSWIKDRNDTRKLFNSCLEFVSRELCIQEELKSHITDSAFEVFMHLNSSDPRCTNTSYVPLIPSTTEGLVTLLQITVQENPTRKIFPDGLIFGNEDEEIESHQFNPHPSHLTSHHRRLFVRSAGGSSEAPNVKTGCYYQLKSLLFSSPEAILKNLLVRGYYSLYEAEILAIFAGMYILLSMATHHISMPTDTVIPTLIVGATWGRMSGLLVNAIKTKLEHTLVDPGGYALIGMSAFWAGSSRLPVTIALLAIEMTQDTNYVVGIVIAVFVATVVGNFLGESQYHAEIHKMGLSFLPQTPARRFNCITVDTLMAPSPRVFYPQDLKTHVNDTLCSTTHNGFPVIDAKGRLRGLVLRSQLERYMKSYRQPLPNKNGSAVNIHANSEKQGPKKYIVDMNGIEKTSSDSDSYGSSSDDMDEVVDLTNMMNSSPAVCWVDTTASKAYNIMRSLSVRHIAVLDRSGRVVGILTRKDFTKPLPE